MTTKKASPKRRAKPGGAPTRPPTAEQESWQRWYDDVMAKATAHVEAKGETLPSMCMITSAHAFMNNGGTWFRRFDDVAIPVPATPLADGTECPDEHGEVLVNWIYRKLEEMSAADEIERVAEFRKTHGIKGPLGS